MIHDPFANPGGQLDAVIQFETTVLAVPAMDVVVTIVGEDGRETVTRYPVHVVAVDDCVHSGQGIERTVHRSEAMRERTRRHRPGGVGSSAPVSTDDISTPE